MRPQSTRAAGLLAIAILGASAAAGIATGTTLTEKEELGKLLFFDPFLSTPNRMSCGTCHDPLVGFADPRTETPTSRGAIQTRFGNRNSPSSAYLIAGPEELQRFNAGYAGGMFWDGRANGLIEQAMGPFLNLLEMNNPTARNVTNDIRNAAYAPLFRETYGEDVFRDPVAAYLAAADAIAAYERSSEVNPFSSKFDAYLRGTVELSPMERMGMMVFHGTGGCSACHSQGRGSGQSCPGGCSCGCAIAGVCTCEGCTCGCPVRGEEACPGGCMCGCAGTGVCPCGPGCNCGCLQTDANACPGGCACGCAFTRFCTCGPGCQCGCPTTPPVCDGGCACGCEWTDVCTCGAECDCGCPQGGMADGHPLLTNHNYRNLGVPKNPMNPFYSIDRRFNPLGPGYIDYGLGAVLAERGVEGAEYEMGKFKVPTLRNIAVSPPYMHNGVFAELRTVIEFYNTRDVPGAGWDPPEVSQNVFTEMNYGNIGLSSEEIDALVAFLETFTDGYDPVRPTPLLAAAGQSVSLAAIGSVYPNPFNTSTRIRFAAGAGAWVRLAVYDVNGRRIRLLVDGPVAPGLTTAMWDGRDQHGNAVASGVYFCRLETGGRQENLRVALRR